MRLLLFGLHMVISTFVAIVCLYLPGHKEGLRFVGYFFYGQAIIALILSAAAPAGQRLQAIVLALAATTWGFCCALVAGMSLGNSWL
ncbi:hypothetical protein G4G27_07115 [Sphingomonas sp. So64.6b]|uniref:hypothetical protein n=1 Tax=Sphingomonas sp. So64.6b TaxID=2997354 RepID=UPI001602524F|nr:hypothetical protein [Sphingomonas sp. So64.6b]QNA83780.1 hypothetical protein G4G27_07115 [Sphingomonas sp. So64.6b]